MLASIISLGLAAMTIPERLPDDISKSGTCKEQHLIKGAWLQKSPSYKEVFEIPDIKETIQSLKPGKVTHARYLTYRHYGMYGFYLVLYHCPNGVVEPTSLKPGWQPKLESISFRLAKPSEIDPQCDRLMEWEGEPVDYDWFYNKKLPRMDGYISKEFETIYQTTHVVESKSADGTPKVTTYRCK